MGFSISTLNIGLFSFKLIKKWLICNIFLFFSFILHCKWGDIFRKCDLSVPGRENNLFEVKMWKLLLSLRRKLMLRHHFSVFWPIRGVFFKQMSSAWYHVVYLGPIHSCIRLVFGSWKKTWFFPIFRSRYHKEWTRVTSPWMQKQNFSKWKKIPKLKKFETLYLFWDIVFILRHCI